MNATLQSIAKALGGEISGSRVIAPGPGHSSRDRSLQVTLDPGVSDGFVVHSYAGDDWRICKDYVRSRLGLAAFRLGECQIIRPQFRASPPPKSLGGPAERLWRRGVDPRGTLVEKYLNGRGLDLPAEAADVSIRFLARCKFGDDYFPAMLALVRDVRLNEPMGIQRTALALDGSAIKLNGKTHRMSLGGLRGGAVKLDPDDAVTAGLVIGEGVETCLAARQIGLRPVWAAVGAAGVAHFPVVHGVRALTILAENDVASARAIEQCAARWSLDGREVIALEPLIGSDFNDMRGRTAP